MEAMLERPPAQLALVIDVVDGNGHEVSHQPLTVQLEFDDGSEAALTGTTGADGRAIFDVHIAEPHTPAVATLASGRERIRTSLRTDGSTHLVIEM